jgi:hypothetical protein
VLDSVAVSVAMVDSRSPVLARSSCNSSVSSAICELSWDIAVSLPRISWLRKNWDSMNSESRKMMTSRRLDSASTKPGQ